MYNKNVKIVIDKRKLETLIRLGVSDKDLLSVITTQSFEPTGDELIDDYLSTLVDVKEFTNWGGSRKNSGRKSKNNQVDFQVEKQDALNLADKDIYIDNNIRIDKNKGVKGGKEKEGFKKPTVEDVRAYCAERSNSVDAERFVDFYSAKDWCIGKNKMKDWKAAVRTWEKQDRKQKPALMQQVAAVWDF